MNADRLLGHYERIADAPDAIARLRRFILDLAVRGKLAEQDPNDEPASELLRQIAAEKARLVKAGKIKKGKPLPDIGLGEFPFDTPRGWEWVRIRNVMGDRGQMIPDRDFTYIDVTAINKEVGCIENAKVTSASKAPSRARKIVRMGDVLYSCVRPYLLNIAIVESEISPSPIASTAFAVLNGFGLVLPRYQWIVLRSPFMVAGVEEKMRGQAYPAINDSDFAILPFPLPPRAEQHRIVAKVDELMGLCDRLEAARTEREATRDRLAAASLIRLNDPDPDPVVFRNHAAFALEHLAPLTTRRDQIKAMRQTILNLAVRGKLVEQDPNDEPAAELLKRIAKEKAGESKKTKPTISLTSSITRCDVPSGWVITDLQSVCASITDGDHLPPPKTESGIPFLVIGNVRSQTIEFTGSRFVSPEYYEVLDPIRRPRSGDLLYTLVGSYGIPVVVRDNQPFCVQRHIGILRPSNFIDVGFLARAMESRLVFEQATACATGIAQKTVPLSGLRRLLIPIPPLAEQHRIVTRADELIALCDRLEASLSTGDDTRRRLLDALLHEVLVMGAGPEVRGMTTRLVAFMGTGIGCV